MARRSRELTGKEGGLREKFKETMEEFFKNLEGLEGREIRVGREIEEKLDALASFVAMARTSVSRDRYSKMLNYQPQAEGSGRLSRELTNLGKGIALVQGKGEVDEEVYSLLRKVASDTLPYPQRRILPALWNEGIYGDKQKDTKELSEMFDQSPEQILRWFDDLKEMGIVERKRTDKPGKSQPYLWKLSDECCELIRTSGI